MKYLIVISLFLSHLTYAQLFKSSIKCDPDFGLNIEGCNIDIKLDPSENYFEKKYYVKLAMKAKRRGYKLTSKQNRIHYSASLVIYGEEAPGYSDLHHEIKITDERSRNCRIIVDAPTDTGGRPMLGTFKEILFSDLALNKALRMIPRCPSM